MQRIQPQSNYVEVLDKPRLKDIQHVSDQNSLSVKVIKDKERLRNCHRLKEIEET